MKKILALLLGVMILAGCKPTESNYRAAYDAAKQKQEEVNSSGTPDGATLQQFDMPKAMLIEGDTMMILSNFVGPVDGGNIKSGEFKKFNIVVAQFKQLFNAKHLMNKLLESGYRDAGVVATRQQNYLVISNQLSTASEVKAALKNVLADPGIHFKSPLPYVLVPSGFHL